MRYRGAQRNGLIGDEWIDRDAGRIRTEATQNPAARHYRIDECVVCPSEVLTLRDVDAGMTCHGGRMESVTGVKIEGRFP